MSPSQIDKNLTSPVASTRLETLEQTTAHAVTPRAVPCRSTGLNHQTGNSVALAAQTFIFGTCRWRSTAGRLHWRGSRFARRYYSWERRIQRYQPVRVYLVDHPVPHIRIQIDAPVKPNRVAGQKPARRGVKVTVRQQQQPRLPVGIVTSLSYPGRVPRCPVLRKPSAPFLNHHAPTAIAEQATTLSTVPSVESCLTQPNISPSRQPPLPLNLPPFLLLPPDSS